MRDDARLSWDDNGNPLDGLHLSNRGHGNARRRVDGGCEMRRDHLHEPSALLGQRVGVGGVETQHADEAIAFEQRHRDAARQCRCRQRSPRSQVEGGIRPEDRLVRRADGLRGKQRPGQERAYTVEPERIRSEHLHEEARAPRATDRAHRRR